MRRDGGFPITTDTAQDYIIYVRAGGFAPASRYVPQEAPTLPLKFTLAPGRNLQGTLLDENDRPVAGADIHLGFSITEHFSMPPGNMLGAKFGSDEDSGYYLLPSAHSDIHGHFLFIHLPDYRFYLTITASGFHSIEDFAAVPSETPQLITIRHLGKITGHVIRQRDGKPVRQFFLEIMSHEHFDLEAYEASFAAEAARRALPPVLVDDSADTF